ncbi:hypothetical protein C8J56DRAFT_1046766 [Mycena floridula]|nr:hypothetical protein C8J56DRAFT_1046766 [Mycena floridula]
MNVTFEGRWRQSPISVGVSRYGHAHPVDCWHRQPSLFLVHCAVSDIPVFLFQPVLNSGGPVDLFSSRHLPTLENMGLTGLWKLLKPIREEWSLTALAVEKGFIMKHRGHGHIVLGINMSLLIFSIQAGLFKQRTDPRLEANPIIRTLFNRLAQYATAPVILVGVFDGPGRPKVKRNKKVAMTPLAIQKRAEELLEAFGFYHVTAPGEADAQLGHLNRLGAIDAIVTEDSDVLVYGGKCIIRRSDSYDLDIVQVYRPALDDASILLIAILCGGDYDKGLQNCGINTAHELCQSNLGTTLLHAATHFQMADLIKFLIKWRTNLQHQLTHNPNKYLKQRHPRLAASVTETFPDPHVVLLYVKPLVLDLNSSRWVPKLPDLAKLASFCEQQFSWGQDLVLVKQFLRNLWPAFVTRQLIQMSYNPDVSIDNLDVRWSIIKSKVRTTGLSYKVQIVALPLTALTILHLPHPMHAQQGVTDVQHTFWIPAAIRTRITNSMHSSKAQGATVLTNTPAQLDGQLYTFSDDNELQGTSSAQPQVPANEVLELSSDEDEPVQGGGGFIDLTGPDDGSQGVIEIFSDIELSSDEETDVMPSARDLKCKICETSPDKATTFPLHSSMPPKKEKKAKAPRQKKSTESLPRKAKDLVELQSRAKANLKEHGKTKGTTTAYAGYMANAKKFVAGFAQREKDTEAAWKESQPAGLSGEEVDPTSDDMASDSEFATAFDGPPKRCTPTAIAMFMALKVFEENCGAGTATSIHAACKRHYKILDGDKYRGRWDADRCLGNPADSADVEDMLEACKNKGNEDDRNHSRAMTVAQMEALLAFTEAFCTTGFTIWTRNCKTTCLQAKDFKFDAEKDDPRPTSKIPIPFFQVNLHHRKNWQNKMRSSGSPLTGNVYNIYPQLKTPAIDMYTHVLAWRTHYELHILGRELWPDDYMFPSMSMNGQNVYHDTPVSKDVVQKKLKEVTTEAGIRGADRFTTHCFRRGGVQYRFMYAPLGQRWTLARIHWWGGWAKNEHRDTLIRHLLDELYNYEEDHSDALCPIKHDASQSHNGEAADIRPMTLADGKHLFQAHFSTFNAANQWQAQSASSFMSFPSVNHQTQSFHQAHSFSIYPSVNHQPQSFRRFPHIPPTPLPTPEPLPLPIPEHVRMMIPNIPKGPNGWHQVVKDWDQADPSRSLTLALKDWTEDEIRRSKLGSKYNQRRMVATEFIDRFKRDEADFLDTYPGSAKGLEQLMIEIQMARQEVGAAKT